MSTESLKLLVKEVYFPSGDCAQAILTLSIGEEVTKLEVCVMQPPFSAPIHSSSITPDTLIQIELFYEDRLWAAAEFRLGEFFAEGLEGESENWVVLNDSQQVEEVSEEYTQVKLWMGFTAARATGKSCPYLFTLEAVFSQSQACTPHTASTRFHQARLSLDLQRKEDRAYIRLQPIGSPELDLDLELPRISATLPDFQLDHFKAVLIALEARVKGVKVVEEELQRLRQEKKKAEQGRRDLEETMSGTTVQLREEGEAAAQIMLKLQEEREALVTDLQRAVLRVRSLEEELEGMKMTIATLNRSVSVRSFESGQLE